MMQDIVTKDGEPINVEVLTGSALTNAEAAVALRVAGAQYADIARVVGYESSIVARNAVLAALSQAASDRDVKNLRDLTHRRLERLLQGVWNKAVTPGLEQDKSVRTALAIIDRHARLMGLDAPQQMVISGPNEAQLRDMVENLVSQVGAATLATEASIIDAEVLGDDE